MPSQSNNSVVIKSVRRFIASGPAVSPESNARPLTKQAESINRLEPSWNYSAQLAGMKSS